MRVTAAGAKRVSMAALICTKAGHRSRLIYRIHLDRGPAKGRRKGFTETDYARLLDPAHQQLGGPMVLVWDSLNTHVSRTMRELVDARLWLTVYQLPPYTTEFNPVEGVCVAAYGLLDCRPRNGPDFVDCSNRMCRPARCYGEVGGCGDRRMSRVISLGAKTRNGGPQKPVPRLV